MQLDREISVTSVYPLTLVVSTSALLPMLPIPTTCAIKEITVLYAIVSTRMTSCIRATAASCISRGWSSDFHYCLGGNELSVWCNVLELHNHVKFQYLNFSTLCQKELLHFSGSNLKKKQQTNKQEKDKNVTILLCDIMYNYI